MIYQLMTDKHTAFVRAGDEATARRILAADAEDPAWNDSTRASCYEIRVSDPPEVIALFDDDKLGI
jgi:hypothetical protein